MLKIGRVTLYSLTLAQILEACSTLREASQRIGVSARALRRVCKARPELARAFVAPPGLVAEWRAAIQAREDRSVALAKNSHRWSVEEVRGALLELDAVNHRREVLARSCRRRAPSLERALLAAEISGPLARGAAPSPAPSVGGFSAGPASPPAGGRSLPSDAERGPDEDCQCIAPGWRNAELAENGGAS